MLVEMILPAAVFHHLISVINPDEPAAEIFLKASIEPLEKLEKSRARSIDRRISKCISTMMTSLGSVPNIQKTLSLSLWVQDLLQEERIVLHDGPLADAYTAIFDLLNANPDLWWDLHGQAVSGARRLNEDLQEMGLFVSPCCPSSVGDQNGPACG